MSALIELVDRTGPIMVVIMALSAVLYSRCFSYIHLIQVERRFWSRDPRARGLPLEEIRDRRCALRARVEAQRRAIGAMIAAAPLLGLLGTVNGMVATFQSLSKSEGTHAMDGLARGISEVLVSTESGLAVALPAMLFMFLAGTFAQGCVRRIGQLEQMALEQASP